MPLSRRDFLVTSGAGALALASAAARTRVASARGLLVEPLVDDVIQRALSAARKAGASYADIRLHRRRRETVAAREDHLSASDASESYGMGVRVLADGAWGFAASSRVEGREAERVALLAVRMAKANARVRKQPVALAPVVPAVDVWQTPLEKDPFKIPLEEKAELLLSLNAAAMKLPGVKYADAAVTCDGEWKLFTSSEGASIEQNITRMAPGFNLTAVDVTGGEFVTRAAELPPRQTGWEYLERSSILADAPLLAAEALEKLKAPSVEPGVRDLILAPSNLWLTIHESAGHATELDRAMLLEADMAGTSFLTPEKRGTLRFGSELVDIYADKTTPGGLASCAYDDDGVPTQRWDLFRKGLWVGYQTTREQAAWIGETASRGSCYADGFDAFPFQRMPNVSLAPGPKPLGIADLIAATDDGIYITGNGSWSIDHQRFNFQFGGQMFYEIKRGKIARALRDVAYQSSSVEFWNRCDLVGGQKEWQLHGAMVDGKGEPIQSNAVSHGCPPARFRRVNILNTNTKGQG
jgi:TldD protein